MPAHTYAYSREKQRFDFVNRLRNAREIYGWSKLLQKTAKQFFHKGTNLGHLGDIAHNFLFNKIAGVQWVARLIDQKKRIEVDWPAANGDANMLRIYWFIVLP